VIVIDDEFESTDLNDFVGVYFGDTTVFESVLNSSIELTPFSPVEDLTFPRRKGFYWMRFQLHNKTIEDKEIMLELGSLGPHYTQLYVATEDEVDTSIMLGSFVPFSDRYYDYRKICFPITTPTHPLPIDYRSA